METIDDIVSIRQQKPFKKLSDLKTVYGIGPKIIEELRKYLKPLPEESHEPDDTVAFIPPTIYQVLTGGLLKSGNSKTTKNLKNHDNTTFFK